MKIDKFTKIFYVENKTFLFNFKTGAIDEVEDSIIKEIDILKKKGSFSSLDWKLKESLLEEMIERGYITFYSEREEADERRWSIERYKEKVIKKKKTISILLDSSVGKKWCSSGIDGSFNNVSATDNFSMNQDEFVSILKAINNENLSNEIDLWLMINSRINDWVWIKREIDNNGLKIRHLYSLAKNESELNNIEDWLKNEISIPITIKVRYELLPFGYISFTKLNQKDISEKYGMIFLENHPFFCPFLYRTFFIDRESNISFCVKRLINGVSIGTFKTPTGQLVINNRWGNELFLKFCEKSDDCIYSIYCQKMCHFQCNLYKTSNSKNECEIASNIETIIIHKIKSLM